jgi:hypothetical protein
VIDGSYRQPPSLPRFVCLSCEERAPAPGPCPGCAVERLPLADPRVRDALAASAERRLQARAGREQMVLGAAAFLAATPLRWTGGWLLGTLLWLLVGLVGTGLAWRAVARFSPRSALHAFRRRRLSGGQAPVADA